MKKLTLIISFLFTGASTIFAQNTFPATGNVGIGTSSPWHILQIDSDGKDVALSSFNSNGPGNRPDFWLTRTRGTKENRQNVILNDQLGSFSWQGYSGSTLNAASIMAVVDETPLSGFMPTRIEFYTSSNSSSLEERMVIKSNGNIGIGTTNPQSKLDVSSPSFVGYKISREGSSGGIAMQLDNANSVGSWRLGVGSQNHFGVYKSSNSFGSEFIILDNGNVGIGTDNPGRKLDVDGDILLRNSNGIKQIYTWAAADDNWRIGMNSNSGFTRSISTAHVQFITFAAGTAQGFAIGVNGGNSSFEIRGSDHMAFFRGNVGLGTTSTGTHKLAVEGSIGAREIKVEATGWSDFVFYDDYQLRPIEEVEEYIEEEGHLPEIPSAEEVAESGINLGEMDAKLLQKVEELTLYLIEQNKENKAQQKEIKELTQYQIELLKKVEELREKVEKLENK